LAGLGTPETSEKPMIYRKGGGKKKTKAGAGGPGGASLIVEGHKKEN